MQGGLQSTIQDVTNLFKQWQKISAQREEFEKNAKNILLERERLEWQVSELEKLQIKPGEWEAISHEHSRLAHSASLLEGAQEAADIISESDQPMLSRLSSLQQKLLKLQSFDSALKPITDALDSARINLQIFK